jgi:hypothetical protein
MRIETGNFERFGKPCSARAGSEWKFPCAPEPVVKVRSVFMNGSLWKSRWGWNAAEVIGGGGFVKIVHPQIEG